MTASQRRHGEPSGGASQSREKADDQSAYIPTPDSTGVVKDYEPIHTWIDPTSYVKSSETAEEGLTGALAQGFTYYMDERDRDWLVKNNEQARGEGTSAFGALSATGAGTRSDAMGRASKGKGKEPDIPQSVTMTEDELELVMGIFEQVAHDKVPFMHHVSCSVLLYTSILIELVFSTSSPRWFRRSQSFSKRSRLHYPTPCSRLLLPLPGSRIPRSCCVSLEHSIRTGRSDESSDRDIGLFLV